MKQAISGFYTSDECQSVMNVTLVEQKEDCEQIISERH